MGGKDKGGGGGGGNVVLACSGASNVGQMAGEVAKRLDADGTAKFFCLAGVGGHVSDTIASVVSADKVLVIDGCRAGCGKAAMDAAGLTGYSRVVLAELGIEKRHVFNWSQGDFDNALDVCRKLLGGDSAVEERGYIANGRPHTGDTAVPDSGI